MKISNSKGSIVMTVLTIIPMISISAQALDDLMCSLIFSAAIDHAKQKDHNKNRLLNRLVEKINPIDRIEKGWDEISGRNKTELPRQMTLYEIRKRGLQLQ